VRKLLSVYIESGDKSLEMTYNLIFDVCFIPDTSLQLELSGFSSEELVLLAKAAFLGKNKNIFNQIYNSSRVRTILNIFVSDFESVAYENPSYFKMFFEFLVSYGFKYFVFESHYLNFILNFYAINRLIVEEGHIIFEFVALDKILNLGFPPYIRIAMQNFGNYRFLSIDHIFMNMRVFNEDTISTFLSDLARYPGRQLNYPASIEFLEFISKSPNLIEKFFELNIKLSFDLLFVKLSRYLDIPNIESASEIIELTDFDSKTLTGLKNNNHFWKIEIIQKKSVADFFFEWESSSFLNISQFDFFKWRLAFSYWIKSDQKNRLREITCSVILKMLRIEFPVEMNQLLTHDDELNTNTITDLDSDSDSSDEEFESDLEEIE
jgi:hypothetical protein